MDYSLLYIKYKKQNNGETNSDRGFSLNVKRGESGHVF